MPPKKTSKSKTGFFGVRQKPFGNFGVEFSDDGRRFWLGTYGTAEEAAHAYDVAAWRSGRPRAELNFPEIETRADAEFLAPTNFQMEERKKKKKPAIRVAPGDSDEAAAEHQEDGSTHSLLHNC